MNRLTTHTGIVAPIALDNVDTDQIIPSREMKTVGKTGLGQGLFAGWRYVYAGKEKTGPNPNFVLNQPAFSNASIILGKRNFGCGSSREHAVWALRDFGIRVLIAESFGRIFANNCARNRVLAITLPAATIESLHQMVATSPGMSLTVDLRTRTIKAVEQVLQRFEVNALDRTMLLEGLDHIDLALKHADAIAGFKETDKRNRSWAHLPDAIDRS